jgi:hypothetical protein
VWLVTYVLLHAPAPDEEPFEPPVVTPA